MEQKSQVDDLVLTQAEPVPPPHPAAAPKPGPQNKGERGASEVDPAVLRELKTLAERVGGLEKLKEVVDILIRLPR